MRLLITIFLVLLSLTMHSCSVNYSFTGAPIPENLKTFSVKPFQNNAANAPAPYGQQFSESLKDRILSQTKLSLQNNNSDIIFEGRVTAYLVQPIAIQNNESAAQNRLTITVQVSYVNTKDPKKNYESSFSRFSDYDATQSLATIESQLLEEINSQLTLDIFNKSFNDW